MTVTYRNYGGNGETGRPTTRVEINGRVVSLTAYKVLELHQRDPHQPSKSIAERLRVTKGRVSQCFSELERVGLVRRGPRFLVAE